MVSGVTQRSGLTDRQAEKQSKDLARLMKEDSEAFHQQCLSEDGSDPYGVFANATNGSMYPPIGRGGDAEAGPHWSHGPPMRPPEDSRKMLSALRQGSIFDMDTAMVKERMERAHRDPNHGAVVKGETASRIHAKNVASSFNRWKFETQVYMHKSLPSFGTSSLVAMLWPVLMVFAFVGAYYTMADEFTGEIGWRPSLLSPKVPKRACSNPDEHCTAAGAVDLHEKLGVNLTDECPGKGGLCVQSAPSSCPSGCSVHGTCNEELGRCDCPHSMGGADCGERRCGNAECYFNTDGVCLNQCQNRGQCLEGFCHCLPGFYGMDCSLMINSQSDRAILVDAGKFPNTASDALRPRPRIYVYEIPPEFNAHYDIRKLDSMLDVYLLERIMSGHHRVSDPDLADFFWIPVATRAIAQDPKGRGGDKVLRAIEYIRACYPLPPCKGWAAPFYDRSRGADHIIAYSTQYGACELFRDHRVPTIMREVISLSYFGLHQAPPNGRYAKAAAPCHVPGKDIVLPPFQALAPLTHSPYYPDGLMSVTTNVTYFINMTRLKPGAEKTDDWGKSLWASDRGKLQKEGETKALKAMMEERTPYSATDPNLALYEHARTTAALAAMEEKARHSGMDSGFKVGDGSGLPEEKVSGAEVIGQEAQMPPSMGVNRSSLEASASAAADLQAAAIPVEPLPDSMPLDVPAETTTEKNIREHDMVDEQDKIGVPDAVDVDTQDGDIVGPAGWQIHLGRKMLATPHGRGETQTPARRRLMQQAGFSKAEKPRDLILFFGGSIKRPHSPHQGGFPVRQQVYELFHEKAGYMIQPDSNMYEEAMSSSKFCLAPAGDGWAHFMTQAVLHGCVPVIIQDGILQPWEEILPYQNFTVRVSESDIPKLPELLEAIHPARLAQMQDELACAAPHFLWSSVFGSIFGEGADQDAFATLMWLLNQRRLQRKPLTDAAANSGDPFGQGAPSSSLYKYKRDHPVDVQFPTPIKSTCFKNPIRWAPLEAEVPEETDGFTPSAMVSEAEITGSDPNSITAATAKAHKAADGVAAAAAAAAALSTKEYKTGSTKAIPEFKQALHAGYTGGEVTPTGLCRYPCDGIPVERKKGQHVALQFPVGGAWCLTHDPC
ncbi:hypothetical protein CYMTET_25293 [Cymbomonas tetramitiformis]|uniref:EGF-like domain-containing protein n=1 Tax=Cymbomonas tetramitiformis TaxID=36881 RepID=A0AAE0KZD7_9CHLO|nr:hypothetical protein CYMTET_25293 [Cymbomonas tetramitiformis]